MAASRAIRTTATTMADSAALLRLMAWLSPAFPVGSFAYSHGIEQAIQDGVIADRRSLVERLTVLLENGSAWNDALILAEAWRRAGNGEDVSDVAELAEAMAGSRERHMETTLQGGAFADAVRAWDEDVTEGFATPYPVIVGIAAARGAIPLRDALMAYLHAFTSNMIQASVRLVALGQRDGVAALATLEPLIIATAERASNSTLDGLGACTLLSDIASMRHETLYSRA
jgi:urease accessory protein